MADKKKFGLIMPKKAETLKMRTNSIFNNDDSDEDVVASKRPKIPQKKIDMKKQKTELEDPSIYEYDSIYDEMKSKQTESLAPKEKKNSRYIETLLKAADKRKKEYERRIDKKIQVEREKEGDKYKDKEAFVTSAYKKKMQEREEEEERERRENMLNEMMDVTKQKDLSGFYRHFLNQTVGEEKIPVFGEKEIKKEVDSDQDIPSDKVNEIVNVDENIDRDSDGIEIDDDDDDEKEGSGKNSDVEHKSKKESRKKPHESRKYRSKRTSRTSEASNSPEPRKKQARRSSESSDAESDSGSEPDEEGNKSSGLQEHKNTNKSNKINEHSSRHDSDEEGADHKSANEDAQPDAAKSKDTPKINIYTKRTVDSVFAEAQARYFQRMAERNSRM